LSNCAKTIQIGSVQRLIHFQILFVCRRGKSDVPPDNPVASLNRGVESWLFDRSPSDRAVRRVNNAVAGVHSGLELRSDGGRTD
jgi:hypothetical protein